MTNNKTTKRALLSSVIALILCFAMLLGTTYAWFTDSVTSANNIITAGNLDIELYYQNDETDDWTEVDEDTNIFKENTLWEPGHTEVVKFKVVNAGSLALKYQLGVNIASEFGSVNVNGENFMLSQFIKFAVISGDNTYADRETAIAAAESAGATPLNEAFESDVTKLDPKVDNTTAEDVYTDVVTMVVYMSTTVGNEANYAKGATVPTIKLGINLFATQAMAEEDSFGSDYDQGAPIVSVPVARPDSAVTLKGAEDVMITLSDELVDALPAGVTEIGMSVSEPVVDETAKTITFAEIELVDQNGNEIDLAALNKTIRVTLPAQDVFPAGETVILYHDGEYVATAVVNADTTISYEVAHLCEVTVSKVELPAVKDDVVEIGNVSQLISFAKSVNAGNSYAGKTVVLTADIDLNNGSWTPIGIASNKAFNGTFDGQGHKIKNLKLAASTADGKYGAGFFGNILGGTVIKNVTFVNPSCDLRTNIVGVAAGYLYGSATFENVNVVNANVMGFGKVGGILGMAADPGSHTVTMTNCAVSGTIGGCYNVGGLMGLALQGVKVELTNCTTDIKLVLKDVSYNKTYATLEDGSIMWIYSDANHYAAAAELYCYYDAAENEFCKGAAKNVDILMVNETLLREAIAKGGTVVLDGNITLSETITIAKGNNVTLDLNGYTITGTDNATASFGLFTNNGTFTVKDSVGTGMITLVATENRGWNAFSSVVSNQPGGKFTLESGTLQHLGGTDMAYGIDNLTNGKNTYAETVINGGYVVSTYRAIRMFLNGVEAQNILTVNGGTIKGANKSIWMQDPSANANTGTLTVAADAKLIGDIYLFVCAGSTTWPVEVSIADAAIAEGSKVVDGNVPAGKIVVKDNGIWTVKDGATVTTADELKAALADGGNIVLLNDVTVTDYLTMNKSCTLYLNGKTLYMSTTNDSYISGGANITIKNGKIDISGTNFTERNGIFNFGGNTAGGNTMTVENVEFYGDGFISYSVFWIAKSVDGQSPNTLNLVDSKFVLKNLDEDGGFIKHPSGVKDCSAINITNTKIDMENGVRLFLYGVYNIKDSEINFVDTTGDANGLRQGQFTIDNSKITITGGDKGISPRYADTVIKNGSVVTINNTKGNDVIFEYDFDVVVDSSSTFTYGTTSGTAGGQVVTE